MLLKFLEKNIQRWWFLILIIFIIIILTIFNKKTILESFSNSEERKQAIRIELMSMLGVSNDRILNIQENGEYDSPEWVLTFDLLPRNVNQKDQPLLKEIKERISLMLSELNFPKMIVQSSQKSLGQFNFQEKPLDNSLSNLNQDDSIEEEKIKAGFINPSYDGQIKYLQYLKSGFHNDPEINRSYAMDNKCQIYLEPLPTFSMITPTSTSTSTF